MATVRAADAADTDAIAALAVRAFTHYTARIGVPPWPMSVDYAAQVAAGRVSVAVEDEQVRGFVVLVDEPDHLELDVLAVDPVEQGRGLGVLLLGFADEEARRRGYDEIRLCTNEAMTENLAYYPRHGYVETHRVAQHGFSRVFFAKPIR